MTPHELRQRRAALLDEAQGIVDLCRAENRGLADPERERHQTILVEARQLEIDATNLDDLAEQRAEVAAVEQRQSRPIATTATITPGRTTEERQASFGDFLRQVAIVADSRASHRQRERAHELLANLYESRYNAWDGDDRSREVRDLAQSSGTAGGYTVPGGMYDQLMQVAGEASIVRSRAQIVPMATDEIDVPLLDQTTAPSAGNTAFYGGVTATWSAEAATLSETEPKFRQAKLTAHELTGYTEVSRTLIQNSAISVDALLRQLFGGAVGWYEDYAFLRGNGIGKPLGVLNSPALIATAARGSATAITFANARKVWVRVPMSSRSRVVWLVSQAAEEAVLDMTGTANSVFVPTGYYITGTNNAAGQPLNYALLGRPAIVSEKLPALNTLGDFMAVDFGMYLVGDRRSMEVATSEHYKFATNQIAYRFVHRVGGMPWLNAAITLADASTTVSPFVALQVQ
jgi:HK97 family phage major capsid protein